MCTAAESSRAESELYGQFVPFKLDRPGFDRRTAIVARNTFTHGHCSWVLHLENEAFSVTDVGPEQSDAIIDLFNL